VSPPVFTYQTRLDLDASQASTLQAYAELHGRAERALFAALRAGRSINDLKRAFLPRFGLTARQFNAIRVGLEGKMASIRERRPDLIAEAKTRIRKAESVIAKLLKRAPGSNKLHQKKRRLATLKAHCAAMEADQATGAVRLCFGSKRLFRAQFNLAANGYASHAAWQADWQRARSSQCFVLGSGDETAGNQTCQATLEANGTLTLRLRLPHALAAAQGGKTLTLTDVRFAYGQDSIVAALARSQRIHASTQDGKAPLRRIGTPLSYRFVRDDQGWRVFVSVAAQPVEPTSRKELGAIGVDVNADHLAVSETDRFGNLIGARRIPLVTYGKTPDQAKALIGDAAISMVEQAKAAGKPLVIEQLDFQKKKAELEAAHPKQARMLSSFAYRQVAAHLKAACYRAGVEVIEVHPAYTSVIGAVNHAQRHGISIHQGAALAIARRGLGCSERPPQRMALVPVRHGGHVTLVLPARNRAQHGWSAWASVRRTLKAAHAAHARSGAANTAPAPLLSATRAVCSHRAFGARFPDANRAQHCSERVLDEVPW